MGLYEKVIAATKPIIGVGPRGLRPAHLRPLFQGFFRDEEAREAWPLSSSSSEGATSAG